MEQKREVFGEKSSGGKKRVKNRQKTHLSSRRSRTFLLAARELYGPSKTRDPSIRENCAEGENPKKNDAVPEEITRVTAKTKAKKGKICEKLQINSNKISKTLDKDDF